MMEPIDPKTLELLGLPPPDQIGVVVRDLQKAIEAYTRLFQWGPFEVIEREYNESASTYRGKPGNFRYRIGYTQLGPIQLEMIQPLRGKTIYNEFLEARGEGFHHFGILIDRIEERVAAMKQMGIDVLQSGRRPGRKYAYMDTEPLIGIMIELRQKTD
jgi:methylmalonyl-CoA/ethylmalonyl-CoA epimerase